jgi:hypothetical protein
MEVTAMKAVLNIKAARQKRGLDIYGMFLTRSQKREL